MVHGLNLEMITTGTFIIAEQIELTHSMQWEISGSNVTQLTFKL